MAVTKVIELIRRAEKILNDEGAVRWTRLELQDWINDAYKEVVLLRPDANSQTATVTLAAGTRQRLSDAGTINLPTAIRVLDVIRNMAATSNKRAVRFVDRRVLDDQLPGWHSETESVNIVHWMFDILTPKEFLVYPPATALAQIELVYSSVPASHALSAGALDPAGSDTTIINLDDIYANVILDYLLYRAYSKDADYAANGQRAINHLNSFNSSLGAKTAIDVATSPANVTPMTQRGA